MQLGNRSIKIDITHNPFSDFFPTTEQAYVVALFALPVYHISVRFNKRTVLTSCCPLALFLSRSPLPLIQIARKLLPLSRKYLPFWLNSLIVAIMHLCLQITEILVKIFAIYDDDKEGIKTLYSLTLVCKALHEPARDALWRFQRSLVSLVKIFPEDVWVEMEDPTVAVRLLSRYQ